MIFGPRTQDAVHRTGTWFLFADGTVRRLGTNRRTLMPEWHEMHYIKSDHVPLAIQNEMREAWHAWLNSPPE